MSTGERIRSAMNSDNGNTFRMILQVILLPLIFSFTVWIAYTFDDSRMRTRELTHDIKTVSDKLDATKMLLELRLAQLSEKDSEHRAEINRIWAEVLRNQSRVERIERTTPNGK